jgi:hypothetical protein
VHTLGEAELVHLLCCLQSILWPVGFCHLLEDAVGGDWRRQFVRCLGECLGWPSLGPGSSHMGPGRPEGRWGTMSVRQVACSVVALSGIIVSTRAGPSESLSSLTIPS